MKKKVISFEQNEAWKFRTVSWSIKKVIIFVFQLSTLGATFHQAWEPNEQKLNI